MNEVVAIFWQRILALAAADGPVIEPTALLAHLSEQSDPFNFLNRLDGFNSAAEVLIRDFPVAPMIIIHWRNSEVSDPAASQIAGLVRWAYKKISEWKSDKKSLVILASLFVFATFSAPSNGFWASVVNKNPSPDFIEQLKKLLIGLRFRLVAPEGIIASLYEIEIAEAFERAESERNWTGMISYLNRLDHLLSLNLVLSQLVLSLAAINPEALLSVLESVNQFSAAVAIIRVLPNPNILAKSENHFLQFALVHLGGSSKLGPRAFPDVSEDHLTEILLKVAKDPSRWESWMQSFNQFPARYPFLQCPLGRALAQLPTSAYEAYTNAINLQTLGGSHNRDYVSQALRVFHAEASKEQRYFLWELAFKKWEAWDFGRNSDQNGLLGITVSDLDYAVVGYALECLDEASFQRKLNKSFERIIKTESEWFKGITEFHHNWLRGLSALQPFTYAQHIAGTENDWLQKGQWLPSLDRYSEIKSGWRNYYRGDQNKRARTG